MTDLVILGTIGLDDLKTPKGTRKGVLGGSASYASIASSFFAKPGVMSIIGEDFPSSHVEQIKDRGVDIKGLVKEGKTFRWSGSYANEMNEAQTISTQLNSLQDYTPEIPSDYINTPYLFLANMDPVLQLKVLDGMISNPFVMTDTMNYWIENKRVELLRVLARTNLLLINEGEARQLFNTSSLVSAAKQALNTGPEMVIIKKGEHGALMFTKNSHFSAPSYPIEDLVDPTGAGDSFAGGLIGYLAERGKTDEKSVRKGIIMGTAIASYVAEGFSTEKINSVTKDDINNRYKFIEEIGKF